ncbi:MAG: hypothetical protein EXR94_10185 [Gemmatimonadetes bacterium]|nr:hypothetical protein [Gemmatimonadota bacterium]
MMTLIREARLRPEYAHLYPELAAGQWLSASEVGATILLSQLKSSRPPSLGERLLPEEYFEFRGGPARGFETRLRTRFGEPGPAAQQH